MSPPSRRRIVAIVLPDLACELAREHGAFDRPFAVIVDDAKPDGDEGEIAPSATVHAVDGRAWRYGARPGQTAAQASAYVGQLQIVRLARARVAEALGAVAEVALAHGTTAALDLHGRGRRDEEASVRYPAGAGAGPFDTVWLDVSGCSRLLGGDDLLCAELAERVGELGHCARVAIADGPRIAQAVARWAPGGREAVVPAGQGAVHLSALPITALPLPVDTMTWLGKLGLFRVGDLAGLERRRLAPRLGTRAPDVLALIGGRDEAPLVAYEPPRRIVEQASFEHALDGLEPLFFVLRGLTARAVARLRARGESTSRVGLELDFDRSILALAEAGGTEEASRREAIDLAVPLASEAELLRTLRAKIERLELPAPVCAVRLVLDDLAAQRHHQLALGKKRSRDPQALPTLLAELGAWLGSDRVGVLAEVATHRPEGRSRLVAADPDAEPRPAPERLARGRSPEPTRLLVEPLELGAPPRRHGALVAAEHHLFVLDRTRLLHRLDGVGWWSTEPLCRDYARAWLHGAAASSGARAQSEHAEALLYLTRDPEGRACAWLHGWYD